MNVTIRIPGKPVGQPRYTTGANKNKYIDRKSPIHAYKGSVKVEWLKTGLKAVPKGIPIELRVRAYFEKSGARTVELKTSKPDNDNVMKAIKDALNGLAWHDDAQVAIEAIEKWTGNCLSETVIEIKTVGAE